MAEARWRRRGRGCEVAFVSGHFPLSERTACKLLGVERRSYQYEPRPDRNAELRAALVKLARQKPPYGSFKVRKPACVETTPAQFR